MTRDELEMLTIAELAELWHVGYRTIERHIASGEIPTVMIGGLRRIRARDAARIVDESSTMVRRPTSTERGSR